MKKVTITSLVAALGIAGTMAAGGTLADSAAAATGPYLGGKYGGFKARGGEFDDERDFYEVVGGWQLTPYFAIEGNYADFGNYGNDVASADLEGGGLALVGQLPVTDSLALYAKGGQFWWDGDVKLLGIEGDLDEESPFYGLGAKFMVTDAFGINAEYKRYEVEYNSSTPDFDDDDSDMDTVTIGANYYF